MEQRVTLGKIYLRHIEDNSDNRTFIKLLFQEHDVRKYFILRPDHSQDLELFVAYLSEQNSNNRALNFIIESENHLAVGLLTSELYQDSNGQIMWNVAYAVLSGFRRNGYAFEALTGLVEYLKNYNIDIISLDINDTNTASSSLAKKCGFEPMRTELGGRLGFLDANNMEMGMRFKWIKKLSETKSKRDQLNYQAAVAYRNKNYFQAIEFYTQSLAEPYLNESPFSDGQIYSNLGMAYSCIKQYNKAFECLIKAFNLGIRNDSVMRELQWLKNNVGLG